MEDPNIVNGIQRGTGQTDDITLDVMRQDLTAEQLKFFRRANSGQEPFELGGRQGIQQIIAGCVLIVVLGLILKYGFNIG
ncbi:hypothetical protein PV336_15775 [Streptomyces sp. MI02-2A]|uniref:hypothetical protein n=1 Tax=Streptomyces sp. MI02-2A TaxID=3028688 RepID=UPI0029AFC963|nr:hypothetical protein [Streptomyces sp. MI02-2A]MDX3260678.1 hypothetical protein [Streptomyces sp. MI02-2A]